MIVVDKMAPHSSNPEVAIRSVMASDAADLVALDLALLKDGRGFLHSESDLTTEVIKRALAIEESLKTKFDGEQGTHLVATFGERVVGAGVAVRLAPLRLQHNATAGLGVHPEFQGVGVGRGLSVALLDWAKTARPAVRRIELGTLADNQRAIALYESMGFKREGLQRGYVSRADGTFQDNVLMALYL